MLRWGCREVLGEKEQHSEKRFPRRRRSPVVCIILTYGLGRLSGGFTGKITLDRQELSWILQLFVPLFRGLLNREVVHCGIKSS